MSEIATPRQKSIQQNALGWVKKSIDDSLQTSESDLKLYIENRDTALLVDVINRLQTLQGVLTMVEQFGAAMLTEEMVSLAQHIEANAEDFWYVPELELERKNGKGESPLGEEPMEPRSLLDLLVVIHADEEHPGPLETPRQIVEQIQAVLPG